MSEPFTREKCGICGEMFEVPMERSRRSGWIPKNATLSFTYMEDDGYYQEKVCGNCYDSINEAVEKTVESLKKGRGPDDRPKSSDVRQS